MTAVVAPRRMDVPPAEIPAHRHADVLLLPREVVDGRGFYDDSVVTLAKELRAQGISAVYAHEPDEREWIGEKSASTIALALVVGVGSDAGWSGLCALLARAKRKRVHVRYSRTIKTLGRTESEWYEIDGPGAEVAEVLTALQTPAGSPESGEDKRA